MKKFISILAALALMCTAAGCASGGSVTLDSADAEVNRTDMVEPEHTYPTPSATVGDTASSTDKETVPTDTADPATTPAHTEAATATDIIEESPSTTATDAGFSDEYEMPVLEGDWDIALDDFDYDYGMATEGAVMMPSEDWLPPEDIIIEPPVIQPEAGLLTGGEWNDNDHWHDWVSLYQTHEDWEQYRDLWQTDYTECRVEVKITDNGKPVEGAKVRCDHMSAVTDNTGTAYLFYNAQLEEDFSRADVVRLLTVEYDGITEQITHWGAHLSSDPVEYELKADISAPKKALDLMLMVDTTGSMMDELMYLQEELKDVISRIQQDNGNLPIRVSVNFYRDEGDDYVVRDFPFTEDIDSAIRDIAAQDANGGGDTPEAVHTALDNALNEHDWEENSTKLMFFVLDAPPHDDVQIIDETNKLVHQAAEMGVRIIPVASSGIDKSTEYLLRSMAFTTGGTYTFLTDDSGIGGDHIEPTIGDYTVEKLNDMMVRIVNNYLRDDEQAAVAIERTQPDIRFEDMLMSLDVNFNDPTHYYILNIMEDGSLYHTSYIGHNSGEFFKKFRACDESAFELAYTQKADSLDSDTLAKLTEYIDSIDTASEYYDYIRDNDGTTNDVEEPFNITVYSYYDGADGITQPFRITSHAGSNIYHETYDQNALAAYKTMQENEQVLDWWTGIQTSN